MASIRAIREFMKRLANELFFTYVTQKAYASLHGAAKDSFTSTSGHEDGMFLVGKYVTRQPVALPL